MANIDGECQECGVVEAHAPDCQRAILFWARQDREHKLAALAELYHPRMRALHAEYAAKRDAIWREYDARVASLRAAA